MSDQALVTSVHNNNEEGTTRIGLRWEGKHEIADFNLENLGKVLNCEAETEDSGWVSVEYPGKAKPGDAISEI